MKIRTRWIFTIILCLLIAIPLAACDGSPAAPNGTLESKKTQARRLRFLLGRDEGARSARLSLAITPGRQTQHRCVWSAHMGSCLSKFSSPNAHPFSPLCNRIKQKTQARRLRFLLGRDEGARTHDLTDVDRAL